MYTCSIRDSRCPETSKNSAICAVWGGGHRLNLNLTKAYATVDDQALYTVLLELDYRGENMNKKTICNQTFEHLSQMSCWNSGIAAEVCVDMSSIICFTARPPVAHLVRAFDQISEDPLNSSLFLTLIHFLIHLLLGKKPTLKVIGS